MTAAAHAQSEDRAVSDPSDDASESVSGGGPPTERRGRFEGYGSIRPIQPASLNRAAERSYRHDVRAAERLDAPELYCVSGRTELGPDGMPAHILRSFCTEAIPLLLE
jgi:hypothetical protein